MSVESGGKCDQRGKTGEWGCFQFMPDTWSYWSIRVIGYVAEQSPINERYVALHKIQSHLNQGYDETEIAAIWNSGSAYGWENKIGVNSSGVSYDVPAYVKKVLAHL